MSNPFAIKPTKTPDTTEAMVKVKTDYGLSSQLLDSEGYKWLLREFFEPQIAAEETVALSIDSTEEEAKLARHRRHALITARDFASTTQESTRRAIQNEEPQ